MNIIAFDQALHALPEDARPSYVLEYASTQMVDTSFLLLYQPLMVSDDDKTRWLQQCLLSAPHDLSELLFQKALPHIQKNVLDLLSSDPAQLWNNRLHDHPVCSSLFRKLKAQYLQEPLPSWYALNQTEKQAQYDWLTHCTSRELQTKWQNHPDSLHFLHDYFCGFYIKEWYMSMPTFGRILESAIRGAPNFQAIADHLAKPYLGGYGSEHMIGEWLSSFHEYKKDFSRVDSLLEHIALLRYGKAQFESFGLIEMAAKDPTFFEYIRTQYSTCDAAIFKMTPRPSALFFLLWTNPDALYQQPAWLTQYNTTIIASDFLMAPSSSEFFWKRISSTIMGHEKFYTTLNALLQIDQIPWKEVTTRNIADKPDVVSTLHQALCALQPNTVPTTSSEIDVHF